MTASHIDQNDTLCANIRMSGQTKSIYYRDHNPDKIALRQVFGNEEYSLKNVRRLGDIQALYRGLKDPLILDLGAHIGSSAAFFRCEFPESQVVAVEPECGNFGVLEKNAEIFDFSTLRAAVGCDSASEVQLYDRGNGSMAFTTFDQAVDGRPSAQVARVSVNDLVTQYSQYTPFIAKIDIEGAEKELFSANTEWIRQFPIIFIEIHDWLFPKIGIGKSVIQCAGELDADILVRGENIVLIRNDVSAFLFRNPGMDVEGQETTGKSQEALMNDARFADLRSKGERCLNEVEADAPTPLADRVRHEIANGRPEAALTLAARAGVEGAEACEVVHLRGGILEKQGNKTEAARLFQRHVRTCTPGPGCLCLKDYGRLLREGKYYQEALRILEQAMAADPSDPRAALHLGLAAEALGHTERARDALAHAYVACEPDKEVAYYLGRLYTNLGQYAEAEAVLDWAAATWPDTGWLQYGASVCKQKQGKLDEALGYVRQALKVQKTPKFMRQLEKLIAECDAS